MTLTVNPMRAMMKTIKTRKMKLRLATRTVRTRIMGPVAYTSLAVSSAVCLWHVHVAFSNFHSMTTTTTSTTSNASD